MQQWQWKGRGSRRAWENIDRPQVFWMEMEYRLLNEDGTVARQF